VSRYIFKKKREMSTVVTGYLKNHQTDQSDETRSVTASEDYAGDTASEDYAGDTASENYAGDTASEDYAGDTAIEDYNGDTASEDFAGDTASEDYVGDTTSDDENSNREYHEYKVRCLTCGEIYNGEAQCCQHYEHVRA
jgi:hypothetical protein